MQEYIIVRSKAEYAAAAALFSEYAQWLGIDLGFQQFDKELQELDKMYAAPSGGIILCRSGNDFVGSVAVRKIDDEMAELKRMYVQPTFRHKAVGKALLERSLELAKEYKYRVIRLDTLSNMLPAISLYKKYGFYEIAAYYHNPNPSAVYFEKQL
jgi:ribosomal protein S18 acetylase RimI-like enzyme